MANLVQKRVSMLSKFNFILMVMRCHHFANDSIRSCLNEYAVCFLTMYVVVCVWCVAAALAVAISIKKNLIQTNAFPYYSAITHMRYHVDVLCYNKNSCTLIHVYTKGPLSKMKNIDICMII